jgi:hypothetical protein
LHAATYFIYPKKKKGDIGYLEVEVNVIHYRLFLLYAVSAVKILSPAAARNFQKVQNT